MSLPSERIYLPASNNDEAQTHPGHEQIREENEHFETAQNQVNEMVNPDLENSSGTKRRKLNSMVWNEFTKYRGEDGNEWARCQHCKKKFNGSSKKGTTHLKNHLQRCPRKRNLGEGAQKSIEPNDLIALESNHCHVTKMFIKYGFTSLKFLKTAIVQVYKEEKSKLRQCFSTLSCRYTLTIDFLGTCFDERAYYSLTVHFIDDGWKLKKKILGLINVGREEDSIESFKTMLLDWNIDMNIFSLMAGGVGSVNKLGYWLRDRGSLPFGRDLLYVEILVGGFAEIVDTRADEAFNVFQKIRECFDFLLKRSFNEHKFHVAVEKAKYLEKEVTSEGASTTLISERIKLLASAVGYREQCCELEEIDPDFKSMNLTTEEWDEATAIYEWLKVLNDADNSFYGSTSHTANVYFQKVCEMFLKMLQWQGNDHDSPLLEYFTSCWKSYSWVLAITAILDPRFKMDIVEQWYTEIYGIYAEAHLIRLLINVTDVYEKYASSFNSCQSSTSVFGSILFQTPDLLGKLCKSSDDIESELDRYLKEPKFSSVEDFDILTWWRENTPNFPTLARMASDFLAIPSSTASDSAKTEMRNIVYSKDLDSDIIEAFLCTKYWLEDSE